MKHIKSLTLFIILMIGATALASGCNQSSKTQGPAVVATVNGKEIGRDEFNKRLQQIAGQQILDQMITEELILQEAKAQKIDISDVDLNKELDETMKRFGGDAQFTEFLEKRGETLADAKSRIKLQLIMQELVGKSVKVSDGEVKTQYDQYKDTLYVGKTLEQAKTEITEQLQQQMMAQKIPTFIEELKAKAKIVNNIAPSTTTTTLKTQTDQKKSEDQKELGDEATSSSTTLASGDK